MSVDLPKYKQLKISLKSHPEVSVVLYSVYEESTFELIYETDDFIIEGVPSDPSKLSYSGELFEYKKDATGVFEKIRIYETKNYIVSYDAEKVNVSLDNENELDPKRTGKGQLSFRVVNYLGKSSLILKKYESVFSFPFEIVPLKIDYEEDYVKLTDDIAKKCSALLLDYASPTNLSFHDDSSKKQESPLEMFIFIRQFCSSENIEYLFQSIKNNPDRQLITEEVMKPFGTAPISRKFFSNPFTYGKNFVDDGNGDFIPEQISSTRKYDSYDTPANRFIRFALNTFSDVCQNVIEKLQDGYSYKEEAIYIKNQIQNILYDPFFDDVQLLTSMPYNNQVLQKREGYAQIFNAFNMLDIAKQLDWEGEKQVYQGQARNIALLYEYWLVFKIMEILQTIGAEIQFDISDENHKNRMFTKENGLLISLREGKTSYYSALIKDKNLKIKFYYNRTFGQKDFVGTDYQGSYSRDFRPDYTLSVYPDLYTEEQAIKLGEVSFIHFDAKYRVTDITSLFGKKQLETEDFSEEKKQETVDTYNRGDLLKMHTYNDAIRKTIGSYVLYPGKTNEENNFSVYDELLPGVGAFAIRPGDKDDSGAEALKKFISDIIEFKRNQSTRQYRKEYFENMVIQSPPQNKDNKMNESEDVEYQMIGFIRNEYLSFLQKSGHIPTSLEDFKSNKPFEFYFYFYAIKNGKVYTIHKETNKAKYLRVTTTDVKDCKVELGYKFQHLEPWEAEVESIELVSQESLKKKLDELYGENTFKPQKGFNADFYYLAKTKVIKYSEIGIVAINVGENDAISVYSPKVIQRIQ